MKQSLLKKLKKIEDKKNNNNLRTLKDIKLPSYILNNYKNHFPYQAESEPDQHYHFKLHLGHYLQKWLDYNLDPFYNPDVTNDPYLSKLERTAIIFEYDHFGVEVQSRELARLDKRNNQYYYVSDIFFFVNHKELGYTHCFIEIDGGIHTKNKEQKHKNRLRYEAIKESYKKRVSNTKLCMIVFQDDEYQHKPTDYFINTIIETLRNKKEKYPEKFLWEIY